jgi:hypothetical protein
MPKELEMKSGARPDSPSVVNIILGGGGPMNGKGPGGMAARMFPDQVGEGPRGQALKEVASGRRQGSK